MKNLQLVALLSLISLPNFASAQDLGDDTCDSLLLVSSWTRNNVKIYDGCSGEYIKNLDSQGLIDGPLGILEAPDGDVLVISETNGRMLKYDRETLTTGAVLLGPGGHDYIANPISALIDEQGMMYATSFTQNSVVKIETQTWQIIDTILPAGNSLLDGIDVGIIIEDNSLYLPGWKSDNIVKVDLATKQATEVVKPRTGGLSRPRSILFDQNNMLVSSEKSHSILVFDKDDGTYKSTLANVSSPSGMIKDGDGFYLVTAGNSVYRKAIDGSSSEQIIKAGAGSLAGATFVYRLAKLGKDNDKDGLTNEDEVIYGTDVDNPDTDSDTLNDGDEVHTYQTDPLYGDSDHDGMPDGYEVTHQLEPLVNDSKGDKDADSLNNLDEMLAETDPNNPDTDGDGVFDGIDSDPLVANIPPEISGNPAAEVLEDVTYRFIPTLVYTGDHESIDFDINNLPSWLDFDEKTGELSGTPENDDVGEYSSIVITASNNAYEDKLEGFSITVVNVNDAPIMISDIASQSLQVDEVINVNLTSHFTDVDLDDSLTFSAENIPNGFEFSEAGVFSGSTSIAGIYNVGIIVTDNENLKVQGTLNVTVFEKTKADSASNSSGGAIYPLMALLLLGSIRFKSLV
ncbi:putative Ig domain-containing protein [Colwelliaceae bacterium 6441]